MASKRLGDRWTILRQVGHASGFGVLGSSSERESPSRVVGQDTLDQLITNAALPEQRWQHGEQPYQTRLAAVTVPVAAAGQIHADDDLVGKLGRERGDQVSGRTSAVLQIGAKMVVVLQPYAAREQARW